MASSSPRQQRDGGVVGRHHMGRAHQPYAGTLDPTRSPRDRREGRVMRSPSSFDTVAWVAVGLANDKRHGETALEGGDPNRSAMSPPARTREGRHRNTGHRGQEEGAGDVGGVVGRQGDRDASPSGRGRTGDDGGRYAKGRAAIGHARDPAHHAGKLGATPGHRLEVRGLASRAGWTFRPARHHRGRAGVRMTGRDNWAWVARS